MTIGSRQNLANAKFMNLELDNRPIEHKPSTKLLGVHIDEMLTWDNQIKHISSKVSNGLRMLYLARKLTDNQETLKTKYGAASPERGIFFRLQVYERARDFTSGSILKGREICHLGL